MKRQKQNKQLYIYIYYFFVIKYFKQLYFIKIFQYTKNKLANTHFVPKEICQSKRKKIVERKFLTRQLICFCREQSR